MLALAACATTPQPGSPASTPARNLSTPEAKQDLVRERALARWDLLIKDDLDAAYAYMSAGSQATISLEKFKTNFRRRAFRTAQVEGVSCDGDACIAKLSVTYDHPKMKGITTPLQESWIIDGGQAWYVFGGR